MLAPLRGEIGTALAQSGGRRAIRCSTLAARYAVVVGLRATLCATARDQQRLSVYTGRSRAARRRKAILDGTGADGQPAADRHRARRAGGLKGLETLDLLRAASDATLLERAGQTVVGLASTAAEALDAAGNCARTSSWSTSRSARRAASTSPCLRRDARKEVRVQWVGGHNAGPSNLVVWSGRWRSAAALQSST